MGLWILVCTFIHMHAAKVNLLPKLANDQSMVLLAAVIERSFAITKPLYVSLTYFCCKYFKTD
jgi:hypothetical protein